MDKNKIKFVTFDELKKIEPSLIKYMTFTDGSVAMVDSDKEENDENEELNYELFNKEEKEPDIQSEPNMYLNFGEVNNYKVEINHKNDISFQNYNNKNRVHTVNKNENNNLNRNKNINYKRRNQNILNSNNQNFIRPKKVDNYNQQNKASIKHPKSNLQNNYNNISVYESKYSSIKSNRPNQKSYQNQNNRNINNFKYKPYQNTNEHKHFTRIYHSKEGFNYYNNKCPYCRFGKN